MNNIYMLNDTPSVQDLLNFERYVAPLIQIIRNPQSETPFTIGVFGPWGSGKSTLMQYLDEELEKIEGTVEFFRIKFNPWIYREEKNLMVPLLHTVQDSLNQDPEDRFVVSAKKIGNVLTRLGAALLLKTITVNQVTLKDLEEQEKIYMEQQGRAKSVIRNLRKELQKVINEITNDGNIGRVVFFIDDLDRCEPDQIVGLLESIKLFLDLKYCFFLIAVDDEVVHRGIRIKYNDFQFLKDRKDRIGQEYLEKMIQLPLYLYPLSENQVEDYLKALSPSQPVMNHANLFAEIMLPNPRKIKRTLNLFLLNLAVFQNNKALMAQIKEDVLARLIVIQVQDYVLYLHILKHKDFPEYLSEVHRGKILISDEPAWAKLGERRETIRDLCSLYHRPGSWIERIFKPKDAFPQANELEPYFNMLGRGERG